MNLEGAQSQTIESDIHLEVSSMGNIFGKCVKVSTLEDNTVFFFKTESEAIIPSQGTGGSAGFDVHCIDNATIPAHSSAMLRTGLKMICPPGAYARMDARTSTVIHKGCIVGAGIIDPDYRGEFGILLVNISGKDVDVLAGERLAQLVFEQYISPNVAESKHEFPIDTERGTGRIGSTG